LLQCGRRAIAFVGTANAANPEFLNRWRGYCRALRSAGIEPDDRLRADADPSELSGHAAVAELLDRGVEFDAIFAASDVAAIGAMHALQSLGRTIPDEVAIVGFDDIPAASLSTPRLTTVDQDARRAGEALIEALIEAVEQGHAKNRLLPVRLKIRESSRAA
jgi:DNA-binding LacI/PurR family transcriptional regulator